MHNSLIIKVNLHYMRLITHTAGKLGAAHTSVPRAFVTRRRAAWQSSICCLRNVEQMSERDEMQGARRAATETYLVDRRGKRAPRNAAARTHSHLFGVSQVRAAVTFSTSSAVVTPSAIFSAPATRKGFMPSRIPCWRSANRSVSARICFEKACVTVTSS